MLSRGFRNSHLFQSPKLIQFTRLKTTTTPPTYFSEHLEGGSGSVPAPIFSDSTPSAPVAPPRSQPSFPPSQSTSTQSSRLTMLRDLSIVFSIFTLTYFAVDNYRARLALETKMIEQSMNHMKSLAITQNNFNNQRRKRETQVLNERRNAQKREMKMVYHISMLRKQLIDAGLKPAEIDEAISEFEKNVKMENSISNVSGTALWVIDESPMKAYVPNIHDYESKK